VFADALDQLAERGLAHALPFLEGAVVEKIEPHRTRRRGNRKPDFFGFTPSLNSAAHVVSSGAEGLLD
jgi:hypothetical protein